MIALYNEYEHKLRITVYKGRTTTPEDFNGADVKVFACGETDKYPLQTELKDSSIYATVPAKLPAESYHVEVVWIKENGGLAQSHINSRAYQMALVKNAFTLTENESEATNLASGQIIDIKTYSATYGYDGLNSYEIAVFRGKFAGSETEFLQHERYVSVLQTTGDSEDDTMSQSAITEGLESKVSKDSFGDIGEAEAQELWDEADPIETESSTADFVYATEEDIDGLND